MLGSKSRLARRSPLHELSIPGTRLAALPNLTVERLVNRARNYPDPFRANIANRSYLLGLGIVKDFLGQEWLDKHVDPESARGGYVRLTVGTGHETQLSSWRITDLGEVMFNLQHVPGFAERVEEMKRADPEASIAELHVARIIYINGWPFRFVQRSGERGKDYDYEIESQWDITICADAKCKIESTPLSTRTILNTLSKSRSQLPKDAPGMLCIKFPRNWTDQPNCAEITIGAAQTYFTPARQGVVSVMFYCEPVAYKDGILFQGHIYKEVINPYHRWGTDKDWRLLENWKPDSRKQNKLPHFWIRLHNISSDGYDERY
jgi:hypothetical protein